MTETRDELDLIACLRNDAPVGAPMAVRAQVLRHAMQPRRRRRTALLVAAIASLAVAATATWELGPAAGPSAAAVLSHAAKVVAAQPTLPPPTSDQWLLSGNAQMEPTGSHTINYVWTRFDGALIAMGPLAGPVHVQPSATSTHEGGDPMDWYRLLSSLPMQPDAVLRTLRQNPLYTSEARTQADRDFDAVTQALSKQIPIPSAIRARLYSALAAIPGVGVDEHAAPDGFGRRVLSITYTGELPSARRVDHWEVLLNPKTYAWNGLRGTAGEDFTLESGQRVSKGTVWYEDDSVPNQVVNQPPPATEESIAKGSDCENARVCRNFVKTNWNRAPNAGSNQSGG